MNVKTQTLVRHLVCQWQCWPRAVVGSLESFGKRDAQALVLGLFFIVEALALRMQRREGCGGVGHRGMGDGGRHGHFAECGCFRDRFFIMRTASATSITQIAVERTVPRERASPIGVNRERAVETAPLATGHNYETLNTTRSTAHSIGFSRRLFPPKGNLGGEFFIKSSGVMRLRRNGDTSFHQR